MTTELDRLHRRAGNGHWDQPADGAPRARENPPLEPDRTAGSHARHRGRLLDRNPAWPVVALLAGYPLWWVLGIADYMFVLLAFPMAWRLYTWHRRERRQLRLPPGFSLWLLFLVCMLAGVLMLSLNAPGTIVSPVSNRIISFTARAISYGAVTIVLLYAGNLTERELPRRRLAWLLGLLAIYVVVGGLGGVIDPHFQFTAPLAYVVPHGLQQAMKNQGMLHPGLAQLQAVLGVPEGRPSAPFDFTNTWGNCLAILMPWLLVAWWAAGTRRQRWIAAAALILSIVPVIYSLDRGLWIALLFAVGYIAYRLAARGRLAMLGLTCVGLALVGVVVVATPLGSLISQRLNHGQSNAIRSHSTGIAIQDALASPIIGYGDTRHIQGSSSSIAVGPTANCKSCGQQTVGANGQFQLLLVANGFGGTMFYLAFFAYGAWRYRRDATPYGLAGVLVLLMGFVFMIAYDAVGEPLCFTMLAYALLWRNDTYVQNPDPDSGALTEEHAGARQRAITSRAPGVPQRRPRPAGPARA
jgi:hypothetical protein